MAKEVLVYAEQDSCTGLWTIDVPSRFVIGEKARGSLRDAVAHVVGPDVKVRVLDLTGEHELPYSA